MRILSAGTIARWARALALTVGALAALLGPIDAAMRCARPQARSAGEQHHQEDQGQKHSAGANQCVCPVVCRSLGWQLAGTERGPAVSGVLGGGAEPVQKGAVTAVIKFPFMTPPALAPPQA